MAIDSPAELAFQLMQVESTSGNERAVVDLMERLLREREWQVERIPVNGGRDALLASAGEAIDVTLSTHLDTVPPTNTSLGNDTKTYPLGMGTMGTVNRDLIEDNLGRALTANELTAFATAPCKINLTLT